MLRYLAENSSEFFSEMRHDPLGNVKSLPERNIVPIQTNDLSANLFADAICPAS